MNINETHDIHRVCLSLLTLWVVITWIGLHCDLTIVLKFLVTISCNVLIC